MRDEVERQTKRNIFSTAVGLDSASVGWDIEEECEV